MIRRLAAGEPNPAAAARAGLKAAPKKPEPAPPAVEPHHQKLAGLKNDAANVDEDLVKLYEEASVADPELHTKTEELAKATNGEPKFPPGLKGVKRSKEKIMADYGGRASEICDLVRSTVEYKSFDDMMAALAKIDAGFFKVVRRKNRYAEPTKAGYRDICLNVEMSNGHIAELQMNLVQMLVAKEANHHTYERIRSMEARFKGLKLEMPASHKKNLDQMYAEQKKIYEAALEESKKPGAAAAAPASPAASAPVA